MVSYFVVIGPDAGAHKFIASLSALPKVQPGTAHVIDADAAWLVQCHDPQNTLSRDVIQHMADTSGVDVYASDAAPAKRKLLVADMEATIILNEMLDVLAAERGIGEEIAEITARTMAGELDFEQSLVERTRRFAGTPEALLRNLCRHIQLAPGARALVQTMRASGAVTVLATGGYDVFAEFVARTCGFEKVFSNHPILYDGVMTGELRPPIGTAQTKQNVLLECCATLGIDPQMAC